MSIELEKVLKLKESHEKGGNLPCYHIYAEEKFYGIPTGDYSCTKCGHSISKAEYLKLQNLS